MEFNLLLVVSNTILLLGAGLAFIAPLRKREKWWLWIPVGMVLTFLTMMLGYRSHGLMTFVYYLVTYLVVMLVTNRATALSWMGSCYCAVWIFISSMAAQELWMVARLARMGAEPLDLYGCVQLVLFSGVLFLILSKTLASRIPRGGIYMVGPVQVAGGWLLGGMFSALFHAFTQPGLSNATVRLLLALCQICCLMLLYLQLESNKRRVAEKQVDILNLLCDFGAQQYTVSTKNMELLNRKCGELEEKIRQMERYLPEEVRGEARTALREARVAVDPIVRSGSDVLDIVLTEKKLLAEAMQIQINCVADGKLLRFMEPADIYALFAYGLDTAMEDVRRIQDESHRLIDLLIHESQNFLVINTAHPLQSAAAMRMRNTLNNEKILVIHRIVEKYHGMVSLETEEKFLTLKILIPLAQNKK